MLVRGSLHVCDNGGWKCGLLWLLHVREACVVITRDRSQTTETMGIPILHVNRMMEPVVFVYIWSDVSFFFFSFQVLSKSSSSWIHASVLCVCVYACMGVCMYVCLYICMCMHVSMYGCMCMDGCMYVYMYVCACMYAYMYVHIAQCMHDVTLNAHIFVYVYLYISLVGAWMM